MTDGDVVYLEASRSKTDFAGIEYSPIPSVLPYRCEQITNAAAALVRHEIDYPCHGEARKTFPLFADINGEPYTHAVLDKWLHTVLASLYDEQTAAVHSWHSLRIGLAFSLACALRAEKCPEENIQLICRWATTNSLR
eukprot:6200071-Pleurochrysis_carterae.AAC.1